jgi:hypothetical protein
MAKKKEQAPVALRFESLAEVHAWCVRHGTNPGESSSEEWKAPEQDWDMEAGYAGALDMLANGGWQEGANGIRALALSFGDAERRTSRPRRVRRMAGSRPCAAAVAAGAPRSMMRQVYDRETVRPGHKIMRIVMPWGRSFNVKSGQVLNLGAAIVAAIDSIESAGYRVEFVCRHRIENGDSVEVMVKRPADPLDIAALAFMVAHPASTRRIRFRLNEGDTGKRACDTKYGSPADQEPWAEQERAAGSLVLPYAMGQHWSKDPNEARRFLAGFVDGWMETQNREDAA